MGHYRANIDNFKISLRIMGTLGYHDKSTFLRKMGNFGANIYLI